jgi:adenylate cyclase class IV
MKNLEAKFRLSNHAEAEARASTLGYTQRAILHQRDTFFRVANGKLKLREENGSAVLIYYHRDESGPLMLSNYEIVKIADPPRTLRILATALGPIAVVEKVRTLMMRDNVRLHLDKVARLGDYGEIEAVIADGEEDHLSPGPSPFWRGDEQERSRSAVNEILAALNVGKDDLIDVSYFEMLAKL